MVVYRYHISVCCPPSLAHAKPNWHAENNSYLFCYLLTVQGQRKELLCQEKRVLCLISFCVHFGCGFFFLHKYKYIYIYSSLYIFFCKVFVGVTLLFCYSYGRCFPFSPLLPNNDLLLIVLILHPLAALFSKPLMP